jgi:3',5'-cyclic AMP phosphodiesterase CpdA
MTRIAHLSDLHFGRTDELQLTTLGAHLRAHDIDHVIVTGDLTQSGRKQEFSAARQWFADLQLPSIAVPGNHDTPVRNIVSRFIDPWGRYQQYSGFEEEPVVHEDRFVFAGLNSARRMRPSLDWSTGKLDSEQLLRISDHFDQAEDRVKLCGFHHPLKGFEDAGKAGQAVLPGTEEVLATLAAAKVDLVMNGHVHKARISIVEEEGWSFLLSQAGTAVSTRLRGEEASYNVIEVNGQDDLKLSVHRWGANAFAEESVHSFVRGDEGWREKA